MSEADDDVYLVDYVLRFNGMCRGCADENGTCPTSGLPCDPGEASTAIRYVIHALRYGMRNGFLKEALP